MLLTDDRLLDVMRNFVTASNRFDFLTGRSSSDPELVDQVSEERRLAGEALKAALVERGWRPAGY